MCACRANWRVMNAFIGPTAAHLSRDLKAQGCRGKLPCLRGRGTHTGACVCYGRKPRSMSAV